ncbi:MAG: hypothetical protein AAFO03_01535 [Bacteroidota bacterium]
MLLSKISKATGEVTGEVSFGRDRQPRYTVDLVTHQVYYHKGRTTLMSYLYRQRNGLGLAKLFRLRYS